MSVTSIFPLSGISIASHLFTTYHTSLGGNCRTTMISTISPASSSFQETSSTLQFSCVAKAVKNEVVKNEDKTESAMLSAYEAEIKHLRSLLNEVSIQKL